jgi:hypothetical protein
MKWLLHSFLILICFFLIPNYANAHTGILEGTITDNITNRPVEGVTVLLKDEHLQATSDTDGRFIFENIPAKVYTLVFQKEEYLLRETRISLTEAKTTTLSITLTPSVINLPDLVVQGDVPVSAASSEVLSMVDFQLRPKNSAQDMLRLVPGLFIAQHAGGGKAEQIFVRGFDCDHGTDVATYVDGMPVNMPSHGHGQGYADLHFLIPETVQDMDITKGPYFAQNGDFSTGATVRFNTLNQLDANSFTTELTTVPTQHVFSGSRALLMLQMPLQSSGVSSYIAADFIYNPGYFDAAQHFQRFTLFNKNVIKLSEKTTANISFNGFGSSWNASGQVPARAVNDGSIDRFGAIDTLEGGTTSRNNLNFELHSKVSGHDFYSQFYFGNYRFKLFSNFTFFLNDPVNGDMIEQTDDRTFLGYNGHYAINGFLGNIPVKTTIGAGFRSDRTNVMLWHSPDRERMSVTANSNVFERNMNGWIREEISFTERFKAELGLRVDYFTFDLDDLVAGDTAHTDVSGYNYQVLAEPKINFIYSPQDNIHFFLNSGIGFHSNDARSVVLDKNNHRLPLAAGAELGSQIRLGDVLFSVALWTLELENELVYVGDEGVTEDNGPSRRNGIDVSCRYQILPWLYADADLNYARGFLLQDFFGEKLSEGNIIPLAPRITSTGGLTVKRPAGWEAALRYRFMGDRPANETNTVTAEGYFLLDAAFSYHWDKIRIGLNIENITNTEWNEAQFDTESRLFDEPAPVSELHFTPGTPVAVKGTVTVVF